ncbi:MAG: PD-(D/E)XK nuclease family protein [Lachnospiraceae bacterium]|nr:PD-(D/E)XK nuclease family protein [Lachnospiraceae bacterium]
MSLQFITGGSGSGKSTYILDKLLKEASGDLGKKFFIIVPDQFTMQTQQDLVNMSECGGIMNIDVLSFSRLAHRIFEELGHTGLKVLDDTGKNLILMRCVNEIRDQLPFLADKLDKPGYIHEIKSALSEFMQYDINDDNLKELIDYAEKGNKKLLGNKLRELSFIYSAFKKYISDNYITTEEQLGVLREDIYRSALLKDSVVVFDGFTGFTPVQDRVVEALMQVCRKVVITLTMDEDSEANGTSSDTDLFRLTVGAMNKLKGIAVKIDCPIEETVHLKSGVRFREHPDLAFLERNLYRKNHETQIPSTNIHITGCVSPRDEVQALLKNIRELNRQGVYYRDMAVITGNLPEYRSVIEKACMDAGLPVFFDETEKLKNNPFIEFIKSAFNIYLKDYTVSTVMQYIRTGMSDITDTEGDIFEEYIKAVGYRGRKAYHSLFTRRTESMKKSEDDSGLDVINDIREKLVASLKPFEELKLRSGSRTSVQDLVKAIYQFLLVNDCGNRLKVYAQDFADANDHKMKSEYSQVYREVCILLEKLHDLCDTEPMDFEEFIAIFNAGIDEIKVGIIPQGVDKLIIGDMLRSRLKPVRYLFFLGLNEGWVPGNTGKGGIISDAEREFLAGSSVTMAPSPREQIYIDRFYMYSNLTKPSDGIYMSYSAMDCESKAIRPSVVIRDISLMFSELDKKNYVLNRMNVDSLKEAYSYFCTLVRRYADQDCTEDNLNTAAALGAFLQAEGLDIDRVIEDAFLAYSPENLKPEVTALLYGEILRASVSRMEQYATCAYSFFIRYGLGLDEDREYGVEARDMGNIYHMVLENFIRKLAERGLTWLDVNEEAAKEIIDEAVEEAAAVHADAIFFENLTNRYIMDRMKKIMLTTVMTLSYQLKKGAFVPFDYEHAFRESYEILQDSGRKKRIELTGKIDRLDICRRDDKTFVKVVDYKSGKKDFSLAGLYHGVQLQMALYMRKAIDEFSSADGSSTAEPAAMLYYHIDEPVIEGKQDDSIEMLELKFRKELRGNGLISGEDEILLSLDTSGDADSDVIRVKRNKDGGFSQGSQVTTAENFKVISDYAGRKILELGREILDGKVDINPVMIGKSSNNLQTESCKYCNYKGICGFDTNIPGFGIKCYLGEDEGELISRMRDTTWER